MSLIDQSTSWPPPLPNAPGQSRRANPVEPTVSLDDAPTFPQLFDRQAALNPSRTALIVDYERLTYAQLHERVDQLARQLRRLGVRAETLVGICLRRTASLPVAILAVLKAGGAYVPLDPAYPRDRLAFMLSDSRAKLLIGEPETLLLVPADPARRDLLIDELAVGNSAGGEDVAAHDAAMVPESNESQVPDPHALAYVIYTSGSTGIPKGVAIEHRTLATLMAGIPSLISDEELAGTLFSSSVCFDASILELLMPLSRGGAVILVQNVLEWPGSPAAAEVTYVQTVPSAMTELLAANLVPSTVKLISLAGEALPPALARRCVRLPGVKKVLNLYGPTEDTVISTGWIVPHDFAGDVVSIGQLMPGSVGYILDEQLQPVPVGVEGELCIGGIKLSRGYLHRDQLNVERFLADPFSKTPGRMYRTGDRCRWNSDGTLQCLGRADGQIKLRGFRIELGEIEHAITDMPGVLTCAVVVTGEGADRALVAHVVTDGSVTSADLQQRLHQRLPRHMVPAAFVFPASLPLTPSGKIDRKSLQARPVEQAARAYVDPQTQTQKHVAAAFARVLSVQHVSATDSFFELGGHSLRAMAVAQQLLVTTGVHIRLRELFEHPTVCGLADRVDALKLDASKSPSNDLMPEMLRQPSFAQRRLWYVDRLLADGTMYNEPFTQRIVGPLDVCRLQRALTAVVSRHAALRAGFAERDGDVVLLESLPAEVPLPIDDLSTLPAANREAELVTMLLDDAKHRFELDRPPLLRARVIRLSHAEHVLSLVMHHVICDDASSRIFLDEISRLYNEPAAVLPPSTDAGLVAAAQHDRLQRGQLELHLQYWKQQLAGAPTMLPLPTRIPRPATPAGKGQRLSFEWSPALTGSFRTFARAESGTSFMLMLAAFNAVLAEWAKTPEVVLGTPYLDRDEPGNGQLLGCFLNTLPLRTTVKPGTSFRSLLQQSRSTALGAFDHAAAPFDHLLRAAGISAGGGPYAPFTNVMLVVLGDDVATLKLSNLACEAVPVFNHTAKGDLVIFAYDVAPAMHGYVEYDAELFNANEIRSMLDRVEAVVSAGVARPDESLIGAESAAPQPTPAASAKVIAGAGIDRDDIERELLQIWRELLHLNTLGLHESFFDLGGHSLLAVRLMHRVRQVFGCGLPLSQLLSSPTVAQLAEVVRRRIHSIDDNTGKPELLVQLQPGEGRRPIFCISGAGGHGFTFRPLAERLGPQWPVYALQFHGLEFGDEVPRLESMASLMIEQIRRVQAVGPYRLLGYSFGGAVAFEMAQQLTAGGDEVELLAVVDTFSPNYKQPLSMLRRLSIHARRWWTASSARRRVMLRRMVRRPLHRSSQRAAVDPRIVAERVITDESYDDLPLLRALKRTEAASMAAQWAYTPRPYPGSMTVFRAVANRPHWLEFTAGFRANGWDLLCQKVKVHDVAGTHYSILQEPHLSDLTAHLREQLGDA